MINQNNAMYPNGCLTEGLPNADQKCILKLEPSNTYIAPYTTEVASGSSYAWSSPPPVGHNTDTDSNGISDALENLTGTTPSDPRMPGYAWLYCKNLSVAGKSWYLASSSTTYFSGAISSWVYNKIP